MPEAYTHIRIARAALAASAQTVESEAAFEMGAHGPDPLFAYRPLASSRPFDLPELGERMHAEECGAFLRALVFRALTPAQRSYALGFLTHYAADAALHPYVEAACREGGQFGGRHGHGFCEVALDSFFYSRDTGEAAVPASACVPELYTAELAEVCELLHAALLDVYGAEISREALADSFHDFRWLHGMFCSVRGGKRVLAWLAERVILHDPGRALSHMSPGRVPADGFAAEWTNPFTGTAERMGPEQLADGAVHTGAGYIKAACCYWQGLGSKERLATLLGDHSYSTGLLSHRAAPEKNDSGLQT